MNLYFLSIAQKVGNVSFGMTGTNPSVGAVLVNSDNSILGTASTGKNGSPHAERILLEQFHNQDLSSCTLYTSLEPCGHQGKNPPCSDIIISSKLSRIVYGVKDPNPLLQNNQGVHLGIQAIQDAGIIVDYCPYNTIPKSLIPFLHRQQYGIPYVTLKLAITLDGKIALGNYNSQWITGIHARKFVHLLRLENDAICVGAKSFIYDNPSLNCRLSGCEEFSPHIIILDRKLSYNNLYNDRDNISIYHNQENTESQDSNCYYAPLYKANDKKLDKLLDIEHVLRYSKVNSVLFEGGGLLATHLLQRGLWNKLILIQSNKIFGNDAIPMVGDLSIKDITKNCEYRIQTQETLSDNENILTFIK